jgi:protein ImuB
MVGIQPGMPLAEALALHEFSLLRQPQSAGKPALHLEAHDPLADHLALVQLATTCQRFSPIVGLEEADRPDCLLLDVSGLAGLFGGEEQLAGQVDSLLVERGFTARIAVADTVGAAWAVTHSAVAQTRPARRFSLVPAGETAALVSDLPIAALRLPAETLAILRQLGIESIGELDRLPRASLHSRFGPQLVRRLDQACGCEQEVIQAQHVASEFEAEWVFEHATDRRDVIETVLEQLLPRVIEPLAGQRKGVLELVCRLTCQADEPWHLPLRLFRSSAAAEHLLDMLRLRLESVWLRSPVTAVRVTVVASGLLDLEQRELFTGQPDRDSPRPLADLVDRLTSRLGRQAVLAAKWLPDAQPEHACQYLPLEHTGAPVSGSRKQPPPKRPALLKRAAFAAGERPLRLYMPPVELSVMAIAPDGPPLRLRWSGGEEQVLHCWGPERIETGWWRSGCVRRDYYRIETDSGQRLWLFRRLHDGRWFLQGAFA